MGTAKLKEGVEGALLEVLQGQRLIGVSGDEEQAEDIDMKLCIAAKPQLTRVEVGV